MSYLNNDYGLSGFMARRPEHRIVSVAGQHYLDPTGSLFKASYGPNSILNQYGPKLDQFLSNYTKVPLVNGSVPDDSVLRRLLPNNMAGQGGGSSVGMPGSPPVNSGPSDPGAYMPRPGGQVGGAWLYPPGKQGMYLRPTNPNDPGYISGGGLDTRPSIPEGPNYHGGPPPGSGPTPGTSVPGSGDLLRRLASAISAGASNNIVNQQKPGVIPPEMQQAYQNYWSSSKPGDVMDWAGGTLKRGETGATYTDPTGRTVQLNPNSDLSQLALQDPFIAKIWNTAYGFIPQVPAGQNNPYQGNVYPVSQQQAYTQGIPGAGSTSGALNAIASQQNQVAIPPQMQQAYQNYFATSKPGDTMNWAGGTLTRGTTGAIYTDPTGATVLLTPNSDLNQLALQNPNIAQAWAMEYGFTPTEQGGSTFDIPEGQDAAQTSTSASNTAATSGMDWNSPVGKTILPYLQKSISGLTGRTEQLPQTLQNLYGGLMRNALGPEAFQGTLNQLASRNMLNSSVGSNAISQTASDIAKNVGKAGYSSLLAGLQQQLGLPASLANIANTVAGKTAGTTGQTQSTSLDPLASYRLLAQMLLAG